MITKNSLKQLSNSKYLAFLCAGLFLAVGVILCFATNGTCDEGDSIRHYQFARGAFKHHEFFFHHWAKPLFVLLASPFAQFGFIGVKIFNVLLSFFSVLFTFGIARQLKVQHRALVTILLIFSPAFIVHALSGLTEPLFAFVLSFSVWLYLKDRYLFSCLLVSFLPFVRSEGLIILGVFGLLLLWEKRIWLVPVLAIGHLVYSISGYFVYKDILWVFTKIPYANLDSMYGKGSWTYFFENLNFVIGWPLYIMLTIGVLTFIAQNLSFEKIRHNHRELFLVYGCAGAYFIAHVTFWALGIFNSFGLLRVMVGILPLFAIIELRSLYLFNCIYNKKVRAIFVFIAVAIVIVEPFLDEKSGWHKSSFMLNTSQQLIKQTADYVKQKYPDYKNSVVYYDAPYLAEELDIDSDDPSASLPTWARGESPASKSLLLWDNWYSVEVNTQFDSLIAEGKFKYITEFTLKDEYNSEHKIVIFKRVDL